MTVTQTRPYITHQGNGSTQDFPYDFLIEDYDELVILTWNTVTKVKRVLSPAEFIITGLGNPDGGVVTFFDLTGPLTSDQRLTIMRQRAYTQNVDIHNQDGFHPEVVEGGLDNAILQVQQVAAQFNSFPFMDDLVPGKYIQVDSQGRKLIMGDRGSESLMIPATDSVGENQVIDQSLPQIKLSPEQAGYSFRTKADAESMGVMDTYPEYIFLSGRATVGEVGARGFYRATVTEPSVEPKLQIGTQWYTWIEPYVTPEACGYNEAVNDTERAEAIQGAIFYASLTKVPVILSSKYSYGDFTLRYLSDCQIIGNGSTTGFINNNDAFTFAIDDSLLNTAWASNVIFKNFEIGGNSPYIADSGGIWLQQTLNAVVDRVQVSGVQIGLKVSGSASFYAEQTRIDSYRCNLCATGLVIGDTTPSQYTARQTVVNNAYIFETEFPLRLLWAATTRVYGSAFGFLVGGIGISDACFDTLIADAWMFQGSGTAHQYDIDVDTMTCRNTRINNPTWSDPANLSIGNLNVEPGAEENVWVNNRLNFVVNVSGGPVLIPDESSLLFTAGSFVSWGTPLVSGEIQVQVSCNFDNDGSPGNVWTITSGNDTNWVYFGIYNQSGGQIDINGLKMSIAMHGTIEYR